MLPHWASEFSSVKRRRQIVLEQGSSGLPWEKLWDKRGHQTLQDSKATTIRVI